MEIVGHPSTTQEFRPPLRIGHLWLAFVGALVAARGGVWMVQTNKSDFEIGVGFFLAGIGPLLAVGSLWRIFSRRTLVFSPAGLEYGSYTGRKRVAWSNISYTSIAKFRHSATNGVWLKNVAAIEGTANEFRGGAWLRALNASMGKGHIVIGWADRDRGAEAFDELLKAWMQRYGKSAAG